MARQFDELIGTNLFDSNFKNAIRDYYTYGFKSYSDFDKSRSALNQDWNNLSKILGEKWQFEKGKYGRNRVILRTSERNTENPADELYFFHKLTYIEGFLNYLLELSSDTRLRKGLDSIPITIDALTEDGNLQNTNEVEYAIVMNWLKEMEKAEKKAAVKSGQKLEEAENTGKSQSDKQLEDVENSAETGSDKENEEVAGKEKILFSKVRMNRQLGAFSDIRYKRSKDRNVDIRLRMKILEELGIVCNLSSEGRTEWRNSWLEQQWSQYHEKSKRRFHSRKTKASPDYWVKSDLTMEVILKFAGEEDAAEQDVAEQLYHMFTFFSQYYPLGEIGTFLNRRIVGQLKTDTANVYRFKHNYLMKSLYDYNFLDFLIAIEQKLICKVIYTHGIQRSRIEKIIVPLQLRISSVNGREYILYYDLKEEKINAFRLEFVDEITVYEKVTEIYDDVASEYENVTVTALNDTNTLNMEKVTRNLILAGEMLPHIWGTEVGSCQILENWEENLVQYQFRIRYRTDAESYIKERIKKECRGHAIREKSTDDGFTVAEVTIRCFPTRELRNWTRSFYGRIESVQKLEEDTFHLTDDVEKLWCLYDQDLDCDKSVWVEDKKQSRRQGEIECNSYKVKGTVVSELKLHGALFHEVFSKYAVILADSILACSSEKSKNLEKELSTRIKKELRYYSQKEVKETVNKLMERTRNAGLLQADGMMRYVTSKKDYMGQLLPLTKLECRWMLTALQDPMAEAFLSATMITKLTDYIRKESLFAVEPFPFREEKQESQNAVFYYDRFIHERRSQNQIHWLRKISKAIKSGMTICLNHRDWKGNQIRDIRILPAWIEYSGRDDEIRIWGMDLETERIRIINLSRIEDVVVEKHIHEMNQTEDGKTENQENKVPWMEVVKTEKRVQNKLAENNLKQTDGLRVVLDMQKRLDAILQTTMTSIEVEFYEGIRNLPDRILTEFSQWKKKCSYDPKTEKYRITIYYSTYDEREILIRLLGYGAYIKVKAEDADNLVCREIKERVEKQRQILERLKEEGKNRKT